MDKINIVVWDSVGNTLTGVRPWAEWGPDAQKMLLEEDPDAQARVQGFQEIFADYDVELHRVQNVDELSAHIEQADFLVIHKVIVPADVLLRGKKLRLVQHLGLDYRGIPMEAVRQLGIPAAATPLVNYLAVAEHAWALILNRLKVMPQQRVHMLTRGYTNHRWGVISGIKMVRDQTLGLVGFGEIARPMARIARAFEMPVIYWDGVRFENLEDDYGVKYVGWEELWRTSDVISVHLPINNRTHKIIGEKEIGWMKPNALFVNTARGKLVDQEALVKALRERRIGGAGLDVFYEEPLPVDDPLHALHEDLSYHVTITSHTAWQGHWTHIRDSQEIWFNVLRVLKDEPIHFRV
jgi:phosphoglycerate dehydrogenase-like enzyme